VKNTVVISGWKLKDKRKQLELDFVIIAPGFIFHIEVKKSRTQRNQESGLEQLQKGLDLIQSSIPFPDNHGWKYIRSIYFGEDQNDGSTVKPCQRCQQFVLGSADDFSQVWGSLVSTSELALAETGLNCIKFFLHSMYLHKERITNQDVIDYTEDLIEQNSRPVNIIFWTSVQYEVLFNESHTRVAFISQFGTGKTTLLKAKARFLLEGGHQVVFAIFASTEDDKESLLIRGYRHEFEAYGDRIKIYGLNKTGNTQKYYNQH